MSEVDKQKFLLNISDLSVFKETCENDFLYFNRDFAMVVAEQFLRRHWWSLTKKNENYSELDEDYPLFKLVLPYHPSLNYDDVLKEEIA